MFFKDIARCLIDPYQSGDRPAVDAIQFLRYLRTSQWSDCYDCDQVPDEPPRTAHTGRPSKLR